MFSSFISLTRLVALSRQEDSRLMPLCAGIDSYNITLMDARLMFLYASVDSSNILLTHPINTHQYPLCAFCIGLSSALY